MRDPHFQQMMQRMACFCWYSEPGMQSFQLDNYLQDVYDKYFCFKLQWWKGSLALVLSRRPANQYIFLASKQAWVKFVWSVDKGSGYLYLRAHSHGTGRLPDPHVYCISQRLRRLPWQLFSFWAAVQLIFWNNLALSSSIGTTSLAGTIFSVSVFNCSSVIIGLKVSRDNIAFGAERPTADELLWAPVISAKPPPGWKQCALRNKKTH